MALQTRWSSHNPLVRRVRQHSTLATLFRAPLLQTEPPSQPARFLLGQWTPPDSAPPLAQPAEPAESADEPLLPTSQEEPWSQPLDVVGEQPITSTQPPANPTSAVALAAQRPAPVTATPPTAPALGQVEPQTMSRVTPVDMPLAVTAPPLAPPTLGQTPPAPGATRPAVAVVMPSPAPAQPALVAPRVEALAPPAGVAVASAQMPVIPAPVQRASASPPAPTRAEAAPPDTAGTPAAPQSPVPAPPAASGDGIDERTWNRLQNAFQRLKTREAAGAAPARGQSAPIQRQPSPIPAAPPAARSVPSGSAGAPGIPSGGPPSPDVTPTLGVPQVGVQRQPSAIGADHPRGLPTSATGPAEPTLAPASQSVPAVRPTASPTSAPGAAQRPISQVELATPPMSARAAATVGEQPESGVTPMLEQNSADFKVATALPSAPPLVDEGAVDNPGDSSASQPLPLQAIWPVQRLRTEDANAQLAPADSPPGHEEIAGLRATIPTADAPFSPPPLPEVVQRHLTQSETEHPTESKVDVIRPRRPRPIPRPTPAALPEAAPTASSDSPAALVQRVAAEAAPPSGPTEPAAAVWVDTAIGPLPADLWSLIDEPTPSTTIASGQPPLAAASPTPRDGESYVTAIVTTATAETARPTPLPVTEPVQVSPSVQRSPAEPLPAPATTMALSARADSLQAMPPVSTNRTDTEPPELSAPLEAAAVEPALPGVTTTSMIQKSSGPRPRHGAVETESAQRPLHREEDGSADKIFLQDVSPPNQEPNSVAAAAPASTTAPPPTPGRRRRVMRKAQPAPTEPSLPTPAAALPTAKGKPVQRAGEGGNTTASTAAAPANLADGSISNAGAPAAVNVDELARQVYSEIKRKLIVERERLR